LHPEHREPTHGAFHWSARGRNAGAHGGRTGAGPLADEQVVAYTFDVVRHDGFPIELVDQLGVGSLFATLAEAGIMPARALAGVHAISDETIGWGPQKPVRPN
jgi:hypothetical protein